MSDERESLCYDCGSPASFLIYIAGEDEEPHEEFACAVHSRGHWRCAILEPATIREISVTLEAW